MYRKVSSPATEPEEFELPFQGKLDAQNRWVIMAELIPWAEFEGEYASLFSEEIGAPAKSFRMALGALIIKEKLGISDRETVEQIKENPYLQYFIGLENYSNKAPFEASMLVHFRERIDLEIINRINREMVKKQRASLGEEEPEKKLKDEEKSPRKNRGKLILDASCVPADISYPTDLNLLNQARKQTEKIDRYSLSISKRQLKEKTKNLSSVSQKELSRNSQKKKKSN
jgi:hypothetical protein